jgi:threonine/homoserine/homoserine lactone efflux protein
VTSEEPARRRRRFETWRKVMIAGALVLLGLTIGDAAMDGHPARWISVPISVIGYVLLMFGFVLAMRQRREAQEKRAAREREAQRNRPETGG